MALAKGPMTKSVNVPEGDVDITQWKAKHADHFASPQHVSQSKFAEFFGSKDLGCRLWIPAAGEARNEMNAKAQSEAQAKRCRILRGEVSSKLSTEPGI
jgi:hypothetical protein